MKVDERVDNPRPWRPPTKKRCSCGADRSSLNVRKHLAGSNHLKVQAASGLRAPTSTKRAPVVQRLCAELKWR